MQTILRCGVFSAAAIATVLGQTTTIAPTAEEVARAQYNELVQSQPYVSALSLPGGTPTGQSPYSTTRSAGTRSRQSEPPVIVQLTPAAPETLTAMSEDLAIMTRVLERGLDARLGEEDKPTKMNLQMLLTGSGRSVRAIHIEGLGPLFMVKVNFPLVAPPKREEKSAQATGSEWEQARREITGITVPDDWVLSSRRDGQPEFNQDQVEALRTALLTALKQATNIRYLKADDLITLCVFGTGGATMNVTVREAASSYRTSLRSNIDANEAPVETSGRSTSLSPTTSGEAHSAHPLEPTKPRLAGTRQSTVAGEATISSPAAGGSEISASRIVVDERTGRIVAEAPSVVQVNPTLGQGTVLTIRVKKSDVDAFAKDKVDLETFQGRATINAYAGAGYEVTSVNTWLRR